MSQEATRSRATVGRWSPPPHPRLGLTGCPVLLCPADIVNKDTKSTLRVLYSLFRKHKLKETADGTPHGSPN